MYECAGTRPGSILRLQLFALVTIVGAISLNAAIYIGLLTNTPKPDNPATIAEPPPTPDKFAFRVVAHAAVHGMKPETATTTARLRPGDVSPAKGAKPTPLPNKETVSAEARPLPRPAPKQGSAILTFPCRRCPYASEREPPYRDRKRPRRRRERPKRWSQGSPAATRIIRSGGPPGTGSSQSRRAARRWMTPHSLPRTGFCRLARRSASRIPPMAARLRCESTIVDLSPLAA